MTFSITERVCIRSHWPSGIPYPPGDNSLVAATINSPPDRCSFVPSDDQTADPTSLFYSMTFSITERVCIRSHWPSGIPYPPGVNSLVAATINSPPDRCSFVPSDDQTADPTLIVLFYDLFHHRACLYTQSLAFGYSVSTRR